uniref:Uncharacterized protein n=2 Tax=unclassified Mycobacterium TaxID=2642494 RepID=A0A5Q5BFK4_MYCSS
MQAMPRFALDLADWFSDNAADINSNIKRYFDGRPGDLFTGRWFEDFAASGSAFRFEASDMLAVEALSVKVPTEAASKLFITEARALQPPPSTNTARARSSAGEATRGQCW